MPALRASVAVARSQHEHPLFNALAGMPHGNDQSRWSWRGQLVWAGKPLNAPPWEMHAGLEHTAPVGWGELFGRLDWSWTDRYHTTFSADPRLMQEAYHDVGVRLRARFGERYELTLWGRNLLDENVVQITGLLNLFNDASWQSFLAEPRSYGVTLRVRF